MPPAAIIFRVSIFFFFIAIVGILIYSLIMYLLTGKFINIFSRLDSWHKKDEARGLKQAKDTYDDTYQELKDLFEEHKKKKGR